MRITTFCTTWFLFLSLLSLSTGSLNAQAPLAKSFPNFDFWSSVVIAKITDQDSGNVSFMIPSFSVATETKVVDETRIRQETRTREINRKVPRTEIRSKMVDGKQVEEAVTVEVMETVTENYTVDVPYTESTERLVETFSPKEPSKVELPLADLKAWTVKGEPISTAVLKSKLKKATKLLALETEPNAADSLLDPFYSSTLAEDIILVYNPTLNGCILAAFECAR